MIAPRPMTFGPNAMHRELLTRALAVGFAISLVACTTQKGSTRPDDVRVAGPKVGADGKVAQPQISTRAKLLFEDAVKAFEAQKKVGKYDFPSLERKFQAAVDEDRNLAEASYNLGVLAEMQGNKAAAVKHYQEALASKPTLKNAAENLAVITQNEGNVQGAVQIYRQILESYPDDASSRARLAEIYRQQGDQEQALQMAREALIREPKTLTAYKVMMRTYLERNQLSMARLVALRAMKLDENDPELHHTVGLILEKEGEQDKAMLQFKKAVEVRPDYLPAHVILARMALKNEDYVGAEEHLRRILQADGKNADALLNLGVAYKGMGDFDKALQHYDAAEKLKPDLAAIYLNRAIILHRYKDAPDRAIELYKKYLQLQPAQPEGTNVFELLADAEGIIRAREEEKRAVEEAKRMEAEMKRQEEEQKKLEAQQKAEEERLKKEEQRSNAAQEALASGDAKDKGATKTAQAEKKEEKKEAPRKVVAPQPAKATSDEPSDEPEDNL